jgi:hypothetical protein
MACTGCGQRLDPERLDELCHRCLDHVRAQLAERLLIRQWGMCYGPSLQALMARRTRR